jgi:hypothetical protein
MNQDRREEPGVNNNSNDQFESDTQRIIHRHLENEDDIISEEDIRNVRVGMIPPETLTTEPEREEQVNEITQEANDSEEKDPNDEPVTPWDLTDQ